jgi:hypothetical protein
MQNIIERYDEINKAMKKRCHGSSRPQVVAPLVLASVIQDALAELTKKVDACGREILYKI